MRRQAGPWMRRRASMLWRPIPNAEENDSHQLSGTRPALRSNLPDFDLGRDRAAAPFRNFAPIRARRETETGKPAPGMFVILSGTVAITQRDGLGHVDANRRAGRRSVPGGCRPAFHARGAGRRNRGGRCRDLADPDRRSATRCWSLKPNSASASCGRSFFAGWPCLKPAPAAPC